VHPVCSELGRVAQHAASVAHAPVAIPPLLDAPPPVDPELPPPDPPLDEPPNPHWLEHFCDLHCCTEFMQLVQFESILL
jgi:hypothetical protein